MFYRIAIRKFLRFFRDGGECVVEITDHPEDAPDIYDGPNFSEGLMKASDYAARLNESIENQLQACIGNATLEYYALDIQAFDLDELIASEYYPIISGNVHENWEKCRRDYFGED